MIKDKISIIIPTYNRPIDIVSRAISSVFNQTYQNFEIIVIDDNAAEDKSFFRQNVIKFIDENNNGGKIALILNKQNLGGALSRNEGIKKATGKYVAFLDDDDEYLPHKLEHQVEFMEMNGLDFSFTDLTIYNEKGIVVDKRVRNDISGFDHDTLLKYHLTKNITGTETFMIKRIILERIGGFSDTKIGHEYYLFHKILEVPGIKIGYFGSDDIKAYRYPNNSISFSDKKICGEKEVYKFKKTFFDILSFKEKRYVSFRHRVVMFIACRRNKKHLLAVAYLFALVICNPVISIKEAMSFRRRIK